MDERCGRRRGRHPGAPIGLRAEVEMVHDPALARRQLSALRKFLLALSDRAAANSYPPVGDETPRVDGLEVLMGPLEAEVVRPLWAAKNPLSVRQVLLELNLRRPAALRYTTVQTVMARLARKQVLARSRSGRRDLYRAAASDAAGLAVARLLAPLGEAAIKPFVEQVGAKPRIRHELTIALSLFL